MWRLHRAGWGLVLLVLVTLGVARVTVLSGGYFYSDDFAQRYRAWQSGLTVEYLTASYNGHVNPVGMLLQWVVQATFPGSHPAVVVATSLMWMGLIGLVAFVGWMISGGWKGAAFAAAMLGMSSFGVEVSLWWSAALYALPYQLAVLVTILGLLFALRQGKRWAGWLAVGGYAIACASFTRGFAAIILVFVAVAGVPVGDRPPLGIRDAWSLGRRYWITMAVLGSAWAASVLLVFASGDMPSGSVSAWLSDAVNLLRLNIMPALWGGPWQWYPVPQAGGWPSVLAIPAPGVAVQVLAALVTLAAVVAVLLLRPQLRTLLVGAVAWVLLVVAFGSAARAGNPLASPSYRYTFDAVLPVVLLATAVLWRRGHRPRIERIAWISAAVLFASATASYVVPSTIWQQTRAGQYVSSARSGFGAIPPGQELLAQGVPPGLVDPVLLAPYANTEAVLAPESGAPAFSETVSDQLLGFTATGVLDRQQVEGPLALPGPDRDCGYAVTAQPRSVPLSGQLIDWDFYARLAYFTAEDTTLYVGSGGRLSTVPLWGGSLRATFFPISGPADAVLLSTGDLDATVCVTDLQVGNRVSASSGEPVPLPPGDAP